MGWDTFLIFRLKMTILNQNYENHNWEWNLGVFLWTWKIKKISLNMLPGLKKTLFRVNFGEFKNHRESPDCTYTTFSVIFRLKWQIDAQNLNWIKFSEFIVRVSTRQKYFFFQNFQKKISTIRKLIKFCNLQPNLSVIGLCWKYFNIRSNIKCPLKGQLGLGS